MYALLNRMFEILRDHEKINFGEGSEKRISPSDKDKCTMRYVTFN